MNEAKIIADSISPQGIRLTTMQVTFHRFVLAEFNTHRLFSRNSASSRAIPVEKQIEKLIGIFEDEIYKSGITYPVEFGTNQKGMQAGPPLVGDARDRAYDEWYDATWSAVEHVRTLSDLNVHKQVANRLIEPFMDHTVIVTSVDYENFFKQRCSPLAQPEIRVAAEMMEKVYRESSPSYVDYDNWHLPYLSTSEMLELIDSEPNGFELCMMISAARCARVSYLTQEGTRDFDKDIELFYRLKNADPPHWSPLEHIATPYIEGLSPGGNFIEFRKEGSFDLYRPYGWAQLRHNLEYLR